MHSLTYHSGFSLNVTSLGKPLTSETRLGPRGRLSEALHSSLFTQNSLDRIPACSASAKAGVTVIFLLLYLGPWCMETVQSIHEDMSRADCTEKNWQSLSPQSSEQALQNPTNQQTKDKTLGSWKLGGPFTSCSMLSEKNRGKVFQGGRSCKDSQLQNHYTTINQDETVGHWALTVACG